MKNASWFAGPVITLFACSRPSPAVLRSSAALTQSSPLAEIRTATPRHLVAIVQTQSTEDGVTTAPDPIDLTPSQWTVNGQAAISVHRDSIPWDAGSGQNNRFPITTRHSLYLELPSPLQSGQTYAVHTPYGDRSAVFDESSTYCESLRVNQVGYHAQDTTRFAVLGTSLGTNGISYRWDATTTYRVMDLNANRVVASGTATFIKDDTAVATSSATSGQYVYHLSLTQVPAGGPYAIVVPGCGRSRSFSVGNEPMRKLAAIAARGFYHQRCGTALTQPYTEYTRGTCHTRIADTKTTLSGDNYGIHVAPGTLTRPWKGGHHDAANFQLREQHVLIPQLMFLGLEAWPSHFIDRQFNIPESGNGIPDLLDEAMWNVLGWENLQITNQSDPQFGGVMAGNMEDHDAIYGTDSAANENPVKGTFAVNDVVTLSCAGIFAQASRLIRPYDPAHADTLLQRAKNAWSYGTKGTPATTVIGPVLYAALQLYEATGEASYHTVFKTLAQSIILTGTDYPHVYLPGNAEAEVQTAHFVTYVLPNPPRPSDPALVTAIRAKITGYATSGGYMGLIDETQPYSQGARAFFAWGALSAQFRYTEVSAVATLFTTDPVQKQKLFNSVAMSLNYALGENPQGLSLLTGTGTDQPTSPAHADSYFTKYGLSDGVTSDHLGTPIGNVPGMLLFGAVDDFSGQLYQRAVTQKFFPPGPSRAVLTRYGQGWPGLLMNEFGVERTNVWLVAHTGFLYDASQDPNAVMQPPVQPPPTPDAGVPAPDAGSVTPGSDASAPIVCILPPPQPIVCGRQVYPDASLSIQAH